MQKRGGLIRDEKTGFAGRGKKGIGTQVLGGWDTSGGFGNRTWIGEGKSGE